MHPASVLRSYSWLCPNIRYNVCGEWYGQAHHLSSFFCMRCQQKASCTLLRKMTILSEMPSMNQIVFCMFPPALSKASGLPKHKTACFPCAISHRSYEFRFGKLLWKWEDQILKILVVSTSPWKNENSIGNTFSNWFEDQSDMEFSNIFFRSGMPNNTVCKDYFRITTVSNIKHCLSRKKIGTHFTYNGEMQKSTTSTTLQAEQKERRFIDFLHKHNLRFVHGLEDTVWKMGRWKNSKLLN